MNYILAIDQSTSGTKAILFDADGTMVDSEVADHQQIYPKPGWVEHDAGEIWSNTLQVARAVVERNRERLENTLALSITNQRETVVVFDRTTGEPLHNAIVWQCRRGDAICAELKRNADHEELIESRTGLKVDTYFSASKLKWLIDDNLDIAAKLQSGDALVGTIDSYLIYRLTGGSVHATDHTNASRTLLFDIGRLRWDKQLCALFGVPVDALPEVRESTSGFGETSLVGVLDSPLPVCGVMGDSQASLFAQRCFETGSAKVTIGTGSSILLNVGHHYQRSTGGAVAALAWVIEGVPTYALEGIINYSAATISWLKNQLELITDAGETELLANSVADNGGVYFVPAFTGLSAPYWNPDARAAVVGMSAHTTKAHVVRAALESIAYQIRDVVEMMCNDVGVEVAAINADGGATKNRFLMQFVADTLDREVNVASMPELSALGAAMCGFIGTGLFKGIEPLADLSRKQSIYRPEMERGQAARLYSDWRSAVKRVL